MSIAHSDLVIFHPVLNTIFSPKRATILRLCHISSIGFKPGLLKNVHLLFSSHFFVVLSFGSLSYWVSIFTDWNRFSSRICLYLAPSMFPLMATRLAVPPAEKQPQRTMLPPPCLMLEMVLPVCWAVFDLHQTYHFAFSPNGSQSFFQKLTEFVTCLLAIPRSAFMLTFLRSGFLLATLS